MAVAIKDDYTVKTRKENMKPEIYTVIIHPCTDTSGYWASCTLSNGGCTTQGETLYETQMNMFESMALYLEDYPEVKNYFLSFEVQDA